ncbi:hypothetical protein MNBD_BACTEROID01-1943 [hydrothermal vent metagenome]|uniref:Transposase InsH N-terminal domain-containing protein n=1 Tax=hydrothermal vent metagenome TaxID=652676 RepID=A0A3B0TXT5_9ZZZZ
MQFFVGLEGFNSHSVFDPSLFVDIRKRVGTEIFDAFNVELIKSVSEQEAKNRNL